MSTRAVGAVIASFICGMALTAMPSVAMANTYLGPQTSGKDLSNEEVAAIAQSGVVFVDVKWEGYVQIPATSDSGAAWTDKVTAEGTCSGFVADPTGYIVTAGHCVDPEVGRVMLIDQLLYDSVKDGVLTQADSDELKSDAEVNWKVEGLNNGSEIDLTTTVYQTSAASSIAVSNAMTAAVIEDRPLDKGDVALLKVSSSSQLPALQIAALEPETGADIAVIGFPGSVTETMDPSLEPSFETGQTSAMQSYHGLPFLQHNATVSDGMSGGPVVNMQGQVVGTVSSSPTGETADMNFAAGLETITGLLRRGGANLTLSPADEAYRAGLTSFFAQDYRSAIPQFDKVLATIPSHALAQQYKAKAQGLVSSQPSRTTTPAGTTTPATSSDEPSVWIWVAGGAVMVIILAGVSVWVIRQKRGPQVNGPQGHPHIENLPAPEASGISAHFCQGCGAPNNGAHFCPSCGASQGRVPLT